VEARESPIWNNPAANAGARRHVMKRGPALFFFTVAACATACQTKSSTTCQVSVSPSTGGLMTIFTGTWTSQNAEKCSYAVDGTGAVPIPCNATLSATGAKGGGVGAHTFTITATGVHGVGTCSDTWSVLPSGSDMTPDLSQPPAPLDLAMAPDLATLPSMLDLHDATIVDNPASLADWEVTTTITDLEFQYDGMDGVHVEFSKRDGAGSWPDVTPPGWSGSLEYTLGMAELINGHWYASAAIQFWRGLDQSGGNVGANQQVATNWYYDGRWGAMAGYQPAAGEMIGVFVVAGNVRDVTDDGTQSPVRERSNVVLVPMPTSTGAKYTF
jgi:hypothetical protein